MLAPLALFARACLLLPLVAIDAGHGGQQLGAVGTCGASEKQLTQVLATRLARALARSGRAMPYLVRRADETLGLAERVARANSHAAQMLVSIHANASPNRHAFGVETFFLSQHRATARAAQLAHRENEGLAASEMTASGALDAVLQGLRTDAAHSESQMLAFALQETLTRALHTRGRGVLQAPLMVLVGAQMPAVLVEVGFLSNPQECLKLGSGAYQERIAHALAAGILAHLQRVVVTPPPRFKPRPGGWGP